MVKGFVVGLLCLSFSAFGNEPTTEIPEALVVPPQSIDGEIKIEANSADSSESEILKAAEKIKKEDVTINTKESDVPLFKSKNAVKQAEMTSVSRMALSFGVILAAALGLLFFAKWWAKRSKTNEINAQMRLMNTFHLGPKKSLSIVRVAGEFILLGVTETNITMIKTLSLIDDEYPEASQGFGDKLNDIAANEKDEFVLGSIRDVVGKKLKDFRTL